MDFLESIPFPFVACMVGGALLMVPMFGWWPLLGVIAAMGLMLSTRLHQDAAVALAYVLTAAAFLVVPRVPEFLVGEKGVRGAALLALYYVVPHFELFDLRRRLVHGYGPVEASVYLTVLGYGLVFILVFLMLAWLLYRHKRFVRGALPV